jgi:uncharacterized protein (TIGR03089 family)
MSVTQSLLGPLLASGAPRPLITYYDDATGGRVELSRATAANWAAKTANWLVDELDLEPGSPVAVLIPAHWQTVGVLLGAWWCGAEITDDPQGTEVAFVPASAPERGDGAATIAALGLDALGAPLREVPAGTVDYTSEIRVHGDDFVPLQPIRGDSAALRKSATRTESTVDDVLLSARERASELEIGPNDRVLSTLDWDLDQGVLDGFLAVLAAGAALVQCANLDSGTLERRRASERITRELGVD